jgi:tetratricopeptide (TPR) repeat protein
MATLPVRAKTTACDSGTMTTKYLRAVFCARNAAWAALVCSLTAPFAYGQTQAVTLSNESLLKQHYDAAQKLQSAGNYDQAARQYKIFIADALGELALDRAHAGDYQRAAPLFDEALKLAPNSPILQIEYAQAALRQGELSRARLIADQVLDAYASNPKASAKAHLILGSILLKQGKEREARQQFETAVAREPDFEDGYALSVSCLAMGDREAAVKIFAEMLASFGDSAVLHREIARAYGNSDFPPEAIAELKKAIAENDRLPEAHYMLAAIYIATEGDAKVPEAEQELHEELEISPGYALAYIALGHIALGRHDYAMAETYLQRGAALSPTSPDVFFDLGQVYLETDQPAKAEEALRTSIGLTQDESRNHYQVRRAHYLLGRLLMNSGRTEEGRRELQVYDAQMQKSLGHDRTRLADLLQDPRTGLGITEDNMAAQGSGSFQSQAETDDFQKGVGPAIADSYNNLGAIAASDRDFSDSLKYFEKAAEWTPAMDGLDYNWGKAAFSAGQFQTAATELGHYLSAHPTDAKVRSMLGISQFMTEDYAAARNTMQPIEAQMASTPNLAYVYAVSLVKTKELVRGIERLVTLENSNPEMIDVHRELAEAYRQASRPEDAAREMKEYEALRDKSTEHLAINEAAVQK